MCAVCRGIWLDRGELDKLMDRERNYYDDDNDDWADRPDAHEREYAGRRDDHGRAEDRGRREGAYRQQQPQKKKGFFQSVLETFGEGGEAGGD